MVKKFYLYIGELKSFIITTRVGVGNCPNYSGV